MKKDLLNKILNFIFDKNNTKYLILLFFLGMILRIIFAFMIGGSPDEMVYGVRALGIINSGLLQEMHENPVWMYLTDLMYKIFGMTLISSRLLSIIFGSLSIIILYFLTKEMFDKKIAIISSILLTFSSYHILMTLTEMDIAMTFFILLSSYFLIKYLKEDKLKDYIISTIFLGIGILVKNIGMLFIPAYLVLILLYPKIKNKERIFSKKSIKLLILFFLIMFVIALPTLTFNYILYKEKGMTDLQFSRFLLGENKGIYESITENIQPFSLTTLLKNQGNEIPGILKGLRFYWEYSLFLLITSLVGLVISLKKDKIWSIYLLTLFIIPFIFLSGTSLLEKHFVFAVPILCIFSSLSIDKISKFSKNNSKYIIIILILIFLVISTINLYPRLIGKNLIQKTIEYKERNIEENSLVIVDSRIYNGRIAFIFNDRHYLETNYLSQLLLQLTQPSNEKIKTYFIECVTDDCGWGTINNQPELNQSTENIVSNFKKVSNLKATIYSNKEPYFNIYETEFPYIQGMLEPIKNTHNFFFYPVNYKPKEQIILRYEAKNSIHKLMNILAHIILYIEIIIALFSIILIIKILFEDYKDEAKKI
ncbi:MAG TPA: glycosyltransferase family 39 protein [Candidatus Nanoarchaeia archaeon]|nr:glycosyltransferase family 39 protein [Candidatus Nanoarchaeia archaeon]